MSIWAALAERKFDAVEEYIKNDPALVNAHKDDYLKHSLLMAVLIMQDRPQLLLQFIVSHKDFNIHYKAAPFKSNLSDIISTSSLDLLKLARNKPDFLLKDKLLALTTATEKLGITERMAPGNHPSVREQRLTGFRAMVAYLREETLEAASDSVAIQEALVKHAIKFDDESLFVALQKKGINPTKPFQDGTNPNTLLTSKNLVLNKWFHNPTNSSREAMQQWQRDEVSAKALTELHRKNQSNVLEEAQEVQESIFSKIASLISR